MGKKLYILYECAFGLVLFKVKNLEEITILENQGSIQDYSKFSQTVTIVAYHPFANQDQAINTLHDMMAGTLPEEVRQWLEVSVPKKDGSWKKVKLGVNEAHIGKMIKEEMGIKCDKNTQIMEIFRGIRYHMPKYMKKAKILKKGMLERLQLGLAHRYSRTKIKYDKGKNDNMIIEAINTLDQLNKDINSFVMRIKDWFSWHFPELVKLVPEPVMYCKLLKLIKERKDMKEEMIPDIGEILVDEDLAKTVFETAKMSSGVELAPLDKIAIQKFADRILSLTTYRVNLHKYLTEKMDEIAPNLTALIGEHVGARLISHAGSLRKLAKYPASTVQILGAEKALFRALKKGGNTPKYGLIFHSSFIGRAAQKNKGRISRYLANKASLASRIDCFSDPPLVNVWGVKFREQVEERLEFFKSSSKVPRKNMEVVQECLNLLGKKSLAQKAAEKAEGGGDDESDGESKKKKKKKKKKKRAREEPEEEAEPPAKKRKKDKKKKKKKKKSSED